MDGDIIILWTVDDSSGPDEWANCEITAGQQHSSIVNKLIYYNIGSTHSITTLERVQSI